MESKTILKYSGHLKFETIEILVQHIKNELIKNEIKMLVRKKIVNIFIEFLENIFKYSETEVKDISAFNKFLPKIILEKNDDIFTIIAGNLISSENIAGLKNNIEKVNSMNRAQLQKSYQEIINNNNFSEKGGAGLGLIDISIKSGNKLFYEFFIVNENYAFFEIKVKINNF